MKTFTSTVGFQDEAGNLLVNGSLILTLPQGMYEIAAGGGQVVGGSRIINLDATAKVPASQTGWASDELNPQTAYQVTACSGANGLGKVGFATWLIVGTSPIDLSQMLNATAGAPSVPGVVFTQPAAPQVINGQTLTMEGAALGFSAASSTTPDAFVNRGGSGVVNIGTNSSNAAGTVNAAVYEVGGTGMTGTGGVVLSTSPTITTPTLVTPTLTGTTTFTGTVDAPAFTLSTVAMTGSGGGLVRATSPTIATPTISSPTITTPSISSPTITGTATFLGQTITAFRVQNFTGLSVQAPNATDGQIFTTTLTWTSPFADASYFVLAQVGNSSAGSPVVLQAVAASASTVTVSFTQVSAVQATVTQVLMVGIHL